jgi:pimeloyl-ACP methyl ester carboxylesterase
LRHKVADLDGPVHYIDFGGEGKPLLMVHGLGGNALNWMAVGPELAKRYHAFALDRRRSFIALRRSAPTPRLSMSSYRRSSVNPSS